jgi:uncharacterized protein YjbJ (UPF0337 family)
MKGASKKDVGRDTGRGGTELRGAAEELRGKAENAIGRMRSSVKKSTR